VCRRYYGIAFDDIIISSCFIKAAEIDELHIDVALRKAHRKAIEEAISRFACSPIVVVDGIVNPNLDQKLHVFCLPKGDQIVPAIALASVIAKVLRDYEMAWLATVYPGYGLEKSKGYGTAEHQRAIAQMGPCEIHHRSYAPIKRALEQAQKAPWDFE
jgi:ribonuclease HII